MHGVCLPMLPKARWRLGGRQARWSGDFPPDPGYSRTVRLIFALDLLSWGLRAVQSCGVCAINIGEDRYIDFLERQANWKRPPDQSLSSPEINRLTEIMTALLPFLSTAPKTRVIMRAPRCFPGAIEPHTHSGCLPEVERGRGEGGTARGENEDQAVAQTGRWRVRMLWSETRQASGGALQHERDGAHRHAREDALVHRWSTARRDPETGGRGVAIAVKTTTLSLVGLTPGNTR